MPLKDYGVLKGRPIACRRAVKTNPHYQVHMVDDQVDYRLAINAMPQLSPPEVEFVVEGTFERPIRDAGRLKVDGVAFTAEQAAREG
ncbi:MAG: DUF2278 family protein [Armatimonadetes bacterium]|nr:DUF2278 family protein [Armatimonadota bacterium]